MTPLHPQISGVYVVDMPEEPLAPRRKRGRPRGAQGALVHSELPVTADDMRFLRAFCQGVDPRQAARTYLSHNLHRDGRSAFSYARELLVRLAIQAEAHPERKLAVQLVAELQRRLAQALRQARKPKAVADPEAGQGGAAGALAPHACAQPATPAVAPAAPKPASAPTLEEFGAQFGDGMYSEAELIELYQEAHGGDAAASASASGQTPIESAERAVGAPGVPAIAAVAVPESPDVPAVPTRDPNWHLPVDRRLEILDWLAPRLALALTPEAALTAWLEPALARALRDGQGLTTVSQLAIWVNTRGSRFYVEVPGLGRERAMRLLAWLVSHEALTGVAMRSSLCALVGVPQPPTAARALIAAAAKLELGQGRALAVLPSPSRGVHTLVPLDKLAWPAALRGDDGLLRTREPSLMAVDGVPVANDRGALEYWLRNFVAGKSPATVRGYTSAIERFVLWAVLERRRSLSSMTLDDLVAFREFLYQPPEHWCTRARVMRHSDEWRPLRGPLSEKAVRQVLDVVGLLYGFWHDQAYIRGNPTRGLKAGSADPAVRQRGARKPAIDIARSFAREDLQAMQRELADLEEGPAKRRLRAILSLFLDSGVRRAEVEMLTLGQAVPMRDDDNSLSEMHKVSVLGKGDRVRELPVLASTLACLEQHYADRVALIAAGALPEHFAGIPREQTPLLSVLRVVRSKAGVRRGVSPASAPRVASFDGRLDSKTLYGILKAFFARVGRRNDLVRGQADFSRASTHWLRHTFALQFLAANPGDLPALQGLLGHEDLSTTGIYARFGLSHRARGVARMERFFIPELA